METSTWRGRGQGGQKGSPRPACCSRRRMTQLACTTPLSISKSTKLLATLTRCRILQVCDPRGLLHDVAPTKRVDRQSLQRTTEKECIYAGERKEPKLQGQDCPAGNRTKAIFHTACAPPLSRYVITHHQTLHFLAPITPIPPRSLTHRLSSTFLNALPHQRRLPCFAASILSSSLPEEKTKQRETMTSSRLFPGS